ncbi:transcription termination factor MTERF6, chloroplastic/mitochondrial-like [Zingiber officinale]|uniref:Uncharacterized protein n=1 Tax=Zingiber officinale TaxID=94328 RepID=A0A8J5M0B5_ZINOF|nr:transcription termination factor MTERF6, chloroplastic/mitochondrial-like [Zingiber officinale]XP_042454757.1 transcription termination factor MTERF6, chloroplastic/mitochondrial-like [Zingiber officinale]XP_042454758.1 transcription termination factor MTERF6, chloroplastic/mitochondrial-like [Zingiber officinale]XP_042454759.1 transcription termination factor MTERF6, chloroplastic/mitochondrial-like [Zingiber officinale]KAG6539146.1 hypothetical protein ZIOFF_004299 [Zingiber officinale]
MERGTATGQKLSIVEFFEEKGFDDEKINRMLRKCNRLESIERERASENWDYLESIGIQKRKLPYVIFKCPKILALSMNQKLVPTVQCLATLGSKPGGVASAITKFPDILSHSIELKLCPLLAFFQALGISEKQLGKMLLLNPRLISYSEMKLTQITDFLVSIGFNEEGLIGKTLVKNPFLMGYSIEKRLLPTTEFLKSIGLDELSLQRVVCYFPEVFCRDVNRVLKPNLAFLKGCGFDNKQIANLVAGYPPILIKSVSKSLEPKVRFLVEVMGREISEIADYPEFFRHGMKKSLEFRQKILKQKNVHCSLSEMLSCNQRKFIAKYGLTVGFS